MRNAIAFLLVVLPLGAPQGMEGLDLSAPRKKQPDFPLPPPSEGEEELPPLPGEPAAKPAPKPEPTPDKQEARKEGGQADLLALPEGDVALGDRVKAVQRKGFLKRHRFELSPLFSTSVNDAFYQKLGGGLRVGYYFGDAFGLAVRGAVFQNDDLKLAALRTSNVREGKVAFQSQLLVSQVQDLLMVDGVWSPIYGKVAWLDRSIIHFDLFLTAGFGVVRSSTSEGTQDREGLGPHVAADVGAGLRFYPKEWLALEVGMMLTVYPDQPMETVPGTLQKLVTSNLVVSFFLPPSFEYYYP